MRDVRRPILLFGLSANPPTGLGGHAGLVQWAASGRRFAAFSGRVPAKVWVLPVYVHAFALKRDMAAFHHRMAMARLAFERLPGAQVPVRVLDVERKVAEAWERGEWLGAEPSGPIGTWPGTVDVVRHLYTVHSDSRFGLLLGADTYTDLAAGRWKESRRLKELVDVVVVPRRGASLVEGAATPEPPPLSDISSSVLRVTSDPAIWQKAVLPEVFEYVVKHGLYGFG